MLEAELRQKACDYLRRRGAGVDDPIIVVEEGNGYRVLDGNGRALAMPFLQQGTSWKQLKVRAYAGQGPVPRKDMVVPWGIAHLLDEYASAPDA